MGKVKELQEIYTEAKCIGAAYLAVAIAQGQTQTPYGTKLADLVAKFAKVIEEIEAERKAP
jgi:hypothetical protein